MYFSVYVLELSAAARTCYQRTLRRRRHLNEACFAFHLVILLGHWPFPNRQKHGCDDVARAPTRRADTPREPGSQTEDVVSKKLCCVKNRNFSYFFVFCSFCIFCSVSSLCSHHDGNVPRLADVRGDDDMNTYNGNSTQHMYKLAAVLMMY